MREMEMVKLFHMNGGTGVASYSTNSTLQRKVILMTKTIIEQAIHDLCRSTDSFPETLVMADLGCSSGPNTLILAWMSIKAVHKISVEMGHKPPEIQINLNDLPGNDFNNIFLSIGELQESLVTLKADGNCSPPPCYFAGVPGSFYSRLFPNKTMHFFHSSYSLHWLSQFPQAEEVNKGNIYLSSTTPASVIRAYYEQFQKDFSMFLKCRSEEMVPGGRMVLTFSGRRSNDPCSDDCCYALFAIALNDMVSKGLVEEEKLDSFNLPVYTPSKHEIAKEVEKEGSFAIDRLEASDINWNTWKTENYKKDELPFRKNGINYEMMSNEDEEDAGTGHDMAMAVRAAFEQLIINHFGEEILEEVFTRYEKIITDRMSNKEQSALVSVTVSLIRKD